MPAPLANRFVPRELRVDFEDWMEWAPTNTSTQMLWNYCTFAKQDLYDFDPRGSSRSFATPRSWSFVSQLLSDDLPESTLTDLVAGCVGEGLAVKFMNHRKISGQLPNPSDILSGKVETLRAKRYQRCTLLQFLCAMNYNRHTRRKTRLGMNKQTGSSTT